MSSAASDVYKRQRERNEKFCSLNIDEESIQGREFAGRGQMDKYGPIDNV